jgi:para-aminobenzoate synthetase / 4-amino-4-deoxychorismate lyase
MPPSTRIILDFPGTAAGTPGRLAFTAPRRIITAATPSGVRSTLREAEAEAREHGRWAVGFVAYEAAPAFDDALVTRPPAPGVPLLWFAIFDRPDAGPGAAAADAAGAAGYTTEQAAGPLRWITGTPRPRYDADIAAIREAIAAGDVYQVNHTLRFRAPCDIEPGALFDVLTGSRHGLYHALIETDEWAVVSASPELFVDIRDGVVTTRPMKGTIRRGRWLQEDEDAARRLAASPKDRAENLMIVDLLRNDFGRVAVPGSVMVPRIFDVETYPTVHQMTSTITARLRPGTRLDDIFAAAFPCGSVTGAPKVTAMRTIAALEDQPRGVYCGVIGVVRPDGTATFNVAIRTLFLDRAAGTAVYGAGGGITWDSTADAEYDELVAKAALLTEAVPAFELLETLRLQDGHYGRLQVHLERLDASARYWGFHPDTAAAAARALDALRTELAAGAWRVRLTADRDARIGISRTPLHAPAGALRDAAPARIVALAADAVASDDRLLQHKTTARAVYDRARAAHTDAFDVLLHNENGCITEFTTGNVIADIDGTLVTPPRRCGLLPGTFRAELLADGTIREAVLTVDDVRRARALWFINSVRGWVPVVLQDSQQLVPREPQQLVLRESQRP